MTAPKTTVIVTAYNLESYLPSCLDSILEQSNQNIELIIVDDCSTDNTPSIAQAYAEKDPRITIISPEKNGGCFHACLIGMQAAVRHNNPSDYILLVDGDDLLLPGCLDTLARTAQTTNADIVHFGMLKEINGKRIEQSWLDPAPTPFAGDDVFEQYLNGHIPHSVVTKFFTTALVRKTLSEQLITLSSNYRLSIATDYLQCLMLFRYAQSYFPIKDKLYVYRLRNDSLTMGGIPFNIPNIIQRYRPTYRFAKAYCATVPLPLDRLSLLSTHIPHRIAMSVLTDFLSLGPIDATNPNPHPPIPYTTLEGTIQRYIYSALIGNRPRIACDQHTPLATKLLLQDLLGDDALTTPPQLPTPNTQPLISIIVAAYNMAPYLATCLDSLITQSYPHLEIIVINDGSTDNTKTIAQRYQQKDKRITLINHPHNQGLLAARVTGFSAATGEYATSVDADDSLDQSILALATQRAQVTGADVVHFAMAINEAGKPAITCKYASPRLTSLPNTSKTFQDKIYDGSMPHNLTAKLTKTALYKKAIATGLFDSLERIVKWDDLMFWLVAARFVTHYQPLPRIAYFRLLRDDSIMRKDFAFNKSSDLVHFGFLTRWLADFYRYFPTQAPETNKAYTYIFQTLTAAIEQQHISPTPITHPNQHCFPALYISNDKTIIATNSNSTYHQKTTAPLSLTYPYTTLHQLRPKRVIIDASIRTDTLPLMVFLYGLGAETWLLYPPDDHKPNPDDLTTWLTARSFIAKEIIATPTTATLTQLFEQSSNQPPYDREALAQHYCQMLASRMAQRRSTLWPQIFLNMAAEIKSSILSAALRNSIRRLVS